MKRNDMGRTMRSAPVNESMWRTCKRVSLALLVAGIVLVALMVRTESEPGALPLLLVVLGALGYATGWLKTRH